MKFYFTFLLLHTIFCGIIVLFSVQPASGGETDTLKIERSGRNNQVLINAQQLTDSVLVISEPALKGEITQHGQNNAVKITPPKKTSCCSDDVTGNKNEPGGNNIKISQTGRNNSVKIHSR